MKKVKFDISGMTCSSCVAHVEKAVNKLQGIKKVNVNLLSNSMILEYDENVLDNEKIINAVTNAGYGIKVSNEENKVKNNKRIEKQDDLKNMKKRLITSFIFLIPLMYIAMHQMLNKFLGLPIPELIKNYLSGTENAVNFAFIQFLLLLPILYLNRNYFITGFKRLFKKAPNMDSLIAIGSTASTLYGIFAIFMIGYGIRT